MRTQNAYTQKHEMHLVEKLNLQAISLPRKQISTYHLHSKFKSRQWWQSEERGVCATQPGLPAVSAPRTGVICQERSLVFISYSQECRVARVWQRLKVLGRAQGELADRREQYGFHYSHCPERTVNLSTQVPLSQQSAGRCRSSPELRRMMGTMSTDTQTRKRPPASDPNLSFLLVINFCIRLMRMQIIIII